MISKQLALKLAMIAFPGERDKQKDVLKLWDAHGLIIDCPPEICDACELHPACKG